MPLPPLVKQILTTLDHAGFRAFLAGGCVRDFLLGASPADYDIVAHCSLDTLKTLFRNERIKIAGKTFPVLLVNGGKGKKEGEMKEEVEVAPARSSGAADTFPHADLGTRDFTINSMALDPATGDLIDPFNGREDLIGRIIRFTGNPLHRIKEDPLRMVRACRFKAAIQGQFAPDTLQTIKTRAPSLTSAIAPERLRLEVMKAMAVPRPSIFFLALRETGLLQQIFPCLDRCVALDGGPYHGETVFEHCLMTGDVLSPRKPLLRLAGFLHDTGKFDAARMEPNGLTFKGHETRKEAMVKDLETLRFSTREVEFISAMVQVHMRPLTAKSSPRAVRRLLAFLAEHQVSYQDFMRLRIADKASNRAKPAYTLSDVKIRLKKIYDARARHGNREFTLASLAIDGNDVMTLLGRGPGREIGRILDHLFEQVIDDPSLNTYDKLRALVLDYY